MTEKLYKFKATIHAVPQKGGAYIIFQYDIRNEFCLGSFILQLTFDGISYDGSIVNMGIKNSDGSICYIIGMLKAIREQLGKSEGDEVYVTVRER